MVNSTPVSNETSVAAEAITSFFVYGTLQRNQSRERAWPAKPVSISCGVVRGRLIDFGPYPALVPTSHLHEYVHGEVWTFAACDMPRILRVIDAIEGFDPFGAFSEYLRRPIEARICAAEQFEICEAGVAERTSGACNCPCNASKTNGCNFGWLSGDANVSIVRCWTYLCVENWKIKQAKPLPGIVYSHGVCVAQWNGKG